MKEIRRKKKKHPSHVDQQLQEMEAALRALPSSTHKRWGPHCRHMFRHWIFQRTSLQALVEYFQSIQSPFLMSQLESATDVDTIRGVVATWMETVVRIQDGFVLLQSGECRHAGDVQQATKSPVPYKSRLSQCTTREDGYTQLYQANAVYSGVGWDEWADPIVGLRTRMAVGGRKGTTVRAREDDIWESWGAQGLELWVDAHETFLSDLRRQWQQGLQQKVAFPSHIKVLELKTQDKNERLVLSWGKGEKLKLERQGHKFHFSHPDGILPKECLTVQDWERALKPNGSNLSTRASTTSKTTENVSRKGHKKGNRNAILEDSDSEEDEVKQKHAKPEAETAGFRVVTVQAAPDEDPNTTGVDTSLTSIKQQWGTNAEQLALSRQQVDQEQDCEEAEDLARQRSKIHGLLRIHKQILQESSTSDDLWDIQECLRQAYMDLGQAYLEAKPSKSQQAVEALTKALEWVDRQEKLAAQRKKSDQYTKRYFCLIKSRNLVHRGRAYLESRKSHLAHQDWTEASRHLQRIPTSHKPSSPDDLEYTLQIEQLQVWTAHFRGRAAWQDCIRQQTSASTKDRAVAQLYRQATQRVIAAPAPTAAWSIDVQEAWFGLAVASYRAAMEWTEVLVQQVEDSVDSPKQQQPGALYRWMSWALESLKQAQLILDQIHAHASSTLAYEEEENLPSCEHLKTCYAQLESWWKAVQEEQRQKAQSKRIEGNGVDILASRLWEEEQEQKRRSKPLRESISNPRPKFSIVVDADGRKQLPTRPPRSSSGGGAASNQRISSMGDSDDGYDRPFPTSQDDSESSPVEYFKWGDERLPAKRSAALDPSLPPPIPVEIYNKMMAVGQKVPSGVEVAPL